MFNGDQTQEEASSQRVVLGVQANPFTGQYLQRIDQPALGQLGIDLAEEASDVLL